MSTPSRTGNRGKADGSSAKKTTSSKRGHAKTKVPKSTTLATAAANAMRLMQLAQQQKTNTGTGMGMVHPPPLSVAFAETDEAEDDFADLFDIPQNEHSSRNSSAKKRNDLQQQQQPEEDEKRVVRRRRTSASNSEEANVGQGGNIAYSVAAAAAIATAAMKKMKEQQQKQSAATASSCSSSSSVKEEHPGVVKSIGNVPKSSIPNMSESNTASRKRGSNSNSSSNFKNNDSTAASSSVSQNNSDHISNGGTSGNRRKRASTKAGVAHTETHPLLLAARKNSSNNTNMDGEIVEPRSNLYWYCGGVQSSSVSYISSPSTAAAAPAVAAELAVKAAEKEISVLVTKLSKLSQDSPPDFAINNSITSNSNNNAKLVKRGESSSSSNSRNSSSNSSSHSVASSGEAYFVDSSAMSEAQLQRKALEDQISEVKHSLEQARRKLFHEQLLMDGAVYTGFPCIFYGIENQRRKKEAAIAAAQEASRTAAAASAAAAAHGSTSKRSNAFKAAAAAATLASEAAEASDKAAVEWKRVRVIRVSFHDHLAMFHSFMQEKRESRAQEGPQLEPRSEKKTHPSRTPAGEGKGEGEGVVGLGGRSAADTGVYTLAGSDGLDMVKVDRSKLIPLDEELIALLYPKFHIPAKGTSSSVSLPSLPSRSNADPSPALTAAARNVSSVTAVTDIDIGDDDTGADTGADFDPVVIHRRNEENDIRSEFLLSLLLFSEWDTHFEIRTSYAWPDFLVSILSKAFRPAFSPSSAAAASSSSSSTSTSSSSSTTTATSGMTARRSHDCNETGTGSVKTDNKKTKRTTTSKSKKAAREARLKKDEIQARSINEVRLMYERGLCDEELNVAHEMVLWRHGSNSIGDNNIDDNINITYSDTCSGKSHSSSSSSSNSRCGAERRRRDKFVLALCATHLGAHQPFDYKAFRDLGLCSDDMRMVIVEVAKLCNAGITDVEDITRSASRVGSQYRAELPAYQPIVDTSGTAGSSSSGTPSRRSSRAATAAAEQAAAAAAAACTNVHPELGSICCFSPWSLHRSDIGDTKRGGIPVGDDDNDDDANVHNRLVVDGMSMSIGRRPTVSNKISALLRDDKRVNSFLGHVQLLRERYLAVFQLVEAAPPRLERKREATHRLFKTAAATTATTTGEEKFESLEDFNAFLSATRGRGGQFVSTYGSVSDLYVSVSTSGTSGTNYPNTTTTTTTAAAATTTNGSGGSGTAAGTDTTYSLLQNDSAMSSETRSNPLSSSSSLLLLPWTVTGVAVTAAKEGEKGKEKAGVVHISSGGSGSSTSMNFSSSSSSSSGSTVGLRSTRKKPTIHTTSATASEAVTTSEQLQLCNLVGTVNVKRMRLFRGSRVHQFQQQLLESDFENCRLHSTSLGDDDALNALFSAAGMVAAAYLKSTSSNRRNRNNSNCFKRRGSKTAVGKDMNEFEEEEEEEENLIEALWTSIMATALKQLEEMIVRTSTTTTTTTDASAVSATTAYTAVSCTGTVSVVAQAHRRSTVISVPPVELDILCKAVHKYGGDLPRVYRSYVKHMKSEGEKGVASMLLSQDEDEDEQKETGLGGHRRKKENGGGGGGHRESGKDNVNSALACVSSSSSAAAASAAENGQENQATPSFWVHLATPMPTTMTTTSYSSNSSGGGGGRGGTAGTGTVSVPPTSLPAASTVTTTAADEASSAATTIARYRPIFSPAHGSAVVAVPSMLVLNSPRGLHNNNNNNNNNNLANSTSKSYCSGSGTKAGKTASSAFFPSATSLGGKESTSNIEVHQATTNSSSSSSILSVTPNKNKSIEDEDCPYFLSGDAGDTADSYDVAAAAAAVVAASGGGDCGEYARHTNKTSSPVLSISHTIVSAPVPTTQRQVKILCQPRSYKEVIEILFLLFPCLDDSSFFAMNATVKSGASKTTYGPTTASASKAPPPPFVAADNHNSNSSNSSSSSSSSTAAEAKDSSSGGGTPRAAHQQKHVAILGTTAGNPHLPFNANSPRGREQQLSPPPLSLSVASPLQHTTSMSQLHLHIEPHPLHVPQSTSYFEGVPGPLVTYSGAPQSRPNAFTSFSSSHVGSSGSEIGGSQAVADDTSLPVPNRWPPNLPRCNHNLYWVRNSTHPAVCVSLDVNTSNSSGLLPSTTGAGPGGGTGSGNGGGTAAAAFASSGPIGGARGGHGNNSGNSTGSGVFNTHTSNSNGNSNSNSSSTTSSAHNNGSNNNHNNNHNIGAVIAVSSGSSSGPRPGERYGHCRVVTINCETYNHEVSLPGSRLDSFDTKKVCHDARSMAFAVAMSKFCHWELAQLPPNSSLRIWYQYPQFIMNYLHHLPSNTTFRKQAERAGRGRNLELSQLYFEHLVEQHLNNQKEQQQELKRASAVADGVGVTQPIASPAQQQQRVRAGSDLLGDDAARYAMDSYPWDDSPLSSDESSDNEEEMDAAGVDAECEKADDNDDDDDDDLFFGNTNSGEDSEDGEGSSGEDEEGQHKRRKAGSSARKRKRRKQGRGGDGDSDDDSSTDSGEECDDDDDIDSDADEGGTASASSSSRKSVASKNKRRPKEPRGAAPPPSPPPPPDLNLYSPFNIFWIPRAQLPCLFYDSMDKRCAPSTKFKVKPYSTLTYHYPLVVNTTSGSQIEPLTSANLSQCTDVRTKDFTYALLDFATWESTLTAVSSGSNGSRSADGDGDVDGVVDGVDRDVASTTGTAASSMPTVPANMSSAEDDETAVDSTTTTTGPGTCTGTTASTDIYCSSTGDLSSSSSSAVAAAAAASGGAPNPSKFKWPASIKQTLALTKGTISYEWPDFILDLVDKPREWSLWRKNVERAAASSSSGSSTADKRVLYFEALQAQFKEVLQNIAEQQKAEQLKLQQQAQEQEQVETKEK